VKITRNPINGLTQHKKRNTCKCPEKCTHYILIEDLDYEKRVCEQQATDLAVKLINAAKGTNIVQGTYVQGWTTKMENEIIKWITNQGIKNGDLRLMGEMFNKTRFQVKNKIQHMRKTGRL
jgi:short subunit dehydrogenase-like uncharacterized protein